VQAELNGSAFTLLDIHSMATGGIRLVHFDLDAGIKMHMVALHGRQVLNPAWLVL